MGKRSKTTEQVKSIGPHVSLWVIYLAIGFMTGYIAFANFGLSVWPAVGIGAGAVILIVAVSEILDRKLGWTEHAEKPVKEETAPVTKVGRRADTSVTTKPKEGVKPESKPQVEPRHRNKKVVLAPAEYIEANKGKGDRAIIRGFVEQGGKAEEIKAMLALNGQ